MAGSGTLGWDMVGANLVNAGDDVLIINNGAFRRFESRQNAIVVPRGHLLLLQRNGFLTTLHRISLSSGYFGDNFGECLERYGAKTTHLRGEVGCASRRHYRHVI